MKIRSQWDTCPQKGQSGFPDSVVQSNMSPSISKMVKTRAVGGDLSPYEMDGVENDAPFDSEYVDFFDMCDEAERIASTAKPAEGNKAGKPSNFETPPDPGQEE